MRSLFFSDVFMDVACRIVRSLVYQAVEGKRRRDRERPRTSENQATTDIVPYWINSVCPPPNLHKHYSLKAIVTSCKSEERVKTRQLVNRRRRVYYGRMEMWRIKRKIKSNLQFRKYLRRKINLLPEMLFRLLTVNVGLGAHRSLWKLGGVLEKD